MSTKEIPIADSYPQWLINFSFGVWFDWKFGIYTTFKRFLELATLHDSYYCLITNYLDNSINLIFNFDAFWNQNITNHPGQKVKDWPYLIIKIEKVYNLMFNSNLDCGSTIGDVESEYLSTSELEKAITSFNNQVIITNELLENLIGQDVVKTRISDVCGGFIEILHNESIKILLYDINGVRIELPIELKVVRN